MKTMDLFKVDELQGLAAQITNEHESAVRSVRQGLEHAMEADRLLAQAKEMCEHGKWEAWLESNFRGSIRTAQVYMRLHGRRAEIEAKAQLPALLTCDEALEMIATPRPEALPDHVPAPGYAAEA